MNVVVTGEEGYEEALLGLGFSKGLTSPHTLESFMQNTELFTRMDKVAFRMVKLGGSHAKFLESIVVWLDIQAPRCWWQHFDTYRVGVTKQSESTMNTIMKQELTQRDFVCDIPDDILYELNWLIRQKDFDGVKYALPEGFLQRRIVCTNYKALARIYGQRKKHRLKDWDQFFSQLSLQLAHWHFVTGETA
jgi:hypothetical protein